MDVLRKDWLERALKTLMAQKITGGKGLVFVKIFHFTLLLAALLADDRRHTMKSTGERCRISSIIRVRKKVYDMSSIHETP